MRRILPAAAAALLLALAPSPAQPRETFGEPVAINASRIENFRIGGDETRFSALEFVGGLALSSQARDFGSLSAFRFTAPGTDFLAGADTGFWVRGRIERDETGAPAGMSNVRIMPILDRDGEPLQKKWDADLEGLSISGHTATASFERAHRITEFAIEADRIGPPLRDLDIVVPRHELRMNRGLETIARAPTDGPLAGARIAIAEYSIDRRGDTFGAVLEGPRRGTFTVRLSDDFQITDGTFLPDGDLIILERRYALMTGVAMRLRRIAAADIRPGARLDGQVLLEADMAYQIDNMEGLDIWRREDGATMLSIVSDDNQSFLQRTLYLEFRLVDE